MASVVANTQLGGITNGVETNLKWGVNTLTYKFAVAADDPTITAYLTELITLYGFATAPGTVAALNADFIAAINLAMKEASRVANINFTEAADFASADLKLAGANSTQFGGIMNRPKDNLKGASATDYESYMLVEMSGNDSTGQVLSSRAAETGGSTARNYIAIHELGHGLGIDHTHDAVNGKVALGSGPPAVATDDELDNERYSIMSYEAGGLDVFFYRDFGHGITYSPLDIASLQNMYGKRTSMNNGNTSYKLTDKGTTALDIDGADGSVSIGRAFYTIYDTGGTDKIEYGGAGRVYINLNDAPLTRIDSADLKHLIDLVKRSDLYTPLHNEVKQDISNGDYHAGGFYSRVMAADGTPDLGGYAIANNVHIEDGTGSGGDDVILGNESVNALTGKAGNDLLAGGAQDDGLHGDAGDDTLIGGKGFDLIIGGDGMDTAIFSGICADYDITKDEITGVINIAHVRGDKIDDTDFMFGVEKARFKNGDVDLTVDNPGCPPIDFIFLVDLSGSYSDDLPNFKSSVGGIAAAVREFDPNAQFALASFVDRPQSPWGSSGDYMYKPEQALTDSIPAFQTAVNGLGIFGGNDLPESQLVGLWRAANGVGLNLRENSQKIIFIATDATAHSAADYGLNEATIRNFLENEGIIVAPPIGAAAADSTPDVVPASDGSTVPALGEGLPSPRPDPLGPDDNGLGKNPGSPDGDPLIAATKAILDATGARPIFGVTSGVTSYYEGLETVFGKGSTVRIDGSSTNIADALRLALAELQGVITQAGDEFDNTLIGSDTVLDNIVGAGGADRIEGRDLADTLDGSAGNDTILGEGGGDRMIGGTGNDYLDGGAGDDVLTGGPGIDGIFGGAGSDTVDYSVNGPEQGVVVFLSLKGAFDGFLNGTTKTIDGFDSVENVTGGEGLDVLVGDGGANVIKGNGGKDFLFSNDFGTDGFMLKPGGNDTLEGGGGDDGLFAGDGADTMRGGAGIDSLVGGGGGDSMFGDDGNDFLFGGDFAAGGAFAPNSGNDTQMGGAGNDAIYGFDGEDTINGDAGNDYVEGGDGNDVVNGSGDSDYLLGQNGDDTINGGAGFDYMYGGAGGDTFVFRLGDSADWILDFNAGQGDKLKFEGFGFASFAATPLVDLSTPGNPAVQLTFSGAGGVDQLTVFGVTLAQLNATNVLVA